MTLNNINFIQKTYFKGFFIKNNSCSLDVKDYKFENGVYGIIGKNGSGKTTLAKSLAKLIISSQNINFTKKCIYLSNKKNIFNKDLSIKENILNYLTEYEYQILVSKKKIKKKYTNDNFLIFLLENVSNFYNFILDEDIANLIIPEKKYENFFKKKLESFVFIISHDPAVIQKFCEFCFLIDNSKIISFGKTFDIYQLFYNKKKKSNNSRIKVDFSNLNEFLSSDKTDTLYFNIEEMKDIERYKITASLFFENLLLCEKNYHPKIKSKIRLNKKNLLEGNYRLIIQIFGLNQDKNIIINEEFKYEVLINKIKKKRFFNQVGIIKNMINKI